MKKSNLGTLGEVSRLTLGGGGIGQVWGEVSPSEAIATIHEAIDRGIDLLDSAPGYNRCEQLIGEAFQGNLPTHVKVTTKCGLGNFEPGTAYKTLRASIEKSLKDMRLEHVDLFFLHNPTMCALPIGEEDQRDRTHWHTDWKAYVEELIPAFERIVSDGLTGAWGLTGIDVPTAIIDAVSQQPRPAVVQIVANLMDSPGSLTEQVTNARPREIIAAAQKHGVGVMGIRAVQAGALTRSFDRNVEPDNIDFLDFERASTFRSLCDNWGEDPAIVAHRYALGMEGIDTLVLGVKNRAELRGCLDAEEAGPLESDRVAAIDALGLR